MELYYYPLSRYSQKVLIAFYEKQLNFFPREVDIQDPLARKQFEEICRTCHLPMLKTKDNQCLPESSIIIEYIDQTFDSGTHLIAGTAEQQLNIRLFDRLVDYDLSGRLFEIEKIRRQPAQEINQILLKQLQNQTMIFLEHLDNQLANNHWLCGEQFSLADCALIPCLPVARKEFALFELDHLNRYWQQAELRGSWGLVKEEVSIAESELTTGLRNIP
ncbi:glutathione S-transferase family protein [Shewanella gelidii]|uniref:Glutathione S-transferase n=1 Tax=Shewanella gelidii TaxID=1642821 RepID=A0A917N9X1_9GAMM|nr:glutathione S-transferase family protein [Shewanella gelidii]MCL1099132.1 glutathione S-transferase family protein [Shewanella gelidii]GGI81485.1 glutathione S-transferase [Shewanella gelidii]